MRAARANLGTDAHFSDSGARRGEYFHFPNLTLFEALAALLPRAARQPRRTPASSR
jgi:hypothetical protein